MIRADGKKVCVECGEAKPATTVFFYRCRAASSGLQARCKPCDNSNRGHANGKSIYHRIARELGVTPTRVKQIEQSALRKLRKCKTLRELA